MLADPLAPVDLPALAAPAEVVEWEMCQTGRALRGGRSCMKGCDELSPRECPPDGHSSGMPLLTFLALSSVFSSLNHLEVVAEPEGQTGRQV